jgi:hypothetical protein
MDAYEQPICLQHKAIRVSWPEAVTHTCYPVRTSVKISILEVSTYASPLRSTVCSVSGERSWRRWHECVWRLEWFARGRLTDQGEWETTMRDTERARDHFYACAPKDLGVRGATIPPPSWPPSWVSQASQDDRALSSNVTELQAARVSGLP